MKMKLAAGIAVIVASLLLTSAALAMSSASYRLGWLLPLTNGGGGYASSANYAANLTSDQAAIGASSSPSYQAGLGYWYGVAAS